MSPVDPFLKNRICRFIETHRKASGQLPTLQDFEKAGISHESVDQGVRDGFLEKNYVTLTTGVIVKGYKVHLE